MKGWKVNFSEKELQDLKDLHQLVIHERKGTTKQYFRESRLIEQVEYDASSQICEECFGKTRS